MWDVKTLVCVYLLAVMLARNHLSLVFWIVSNTVSRGYTLVQFYYYYTCLTCVEVKLSLLLDTLHLVLHNLSTCLMTQVVASSLFFQLELMFKTHSKCPDFLSFLSELSGKKSEQLIVEVCFDR